MAEKKNPNPIKDQRAEVFAKSFLENGGNATESYMASHPAASRKTAYDASGDYIRRPEVIRQLQLKIEASKIKLIEAAPKAIDVIEQMATTGTRPIQIGDKIYNVPIRSDDTQRHAAKDIMEVVIGKTKDEGRAAPGKVEIQDLTININIARELMRAHHLDMLAELKSKDEDEGDDIIDVEGVPSE